MSSSTAGRGKISNSSSKACQLMYHWSKKANCCNLSSDNNLVACPLLCMSTIGDASMLPVLTVLCLMRFELVCWSSCKTKKHGVTFSYML
jgi:hypothetical protein